MVAPQFPEVHGRLHGAGRLWHEQLPPAGGASCSVHQECRVGHSGQAAASMPPPCRAATAALPLVVTTHRRAADQDRRQSAASGQRRGDRRFRAGFAARALRSDALAAFRAKGQDARSRRVRQISRANCARKLAADGGAGLAFLAEETYSPTRDRLRAQLREALSEDALVSFTIRS